jgi:hypothetical protein
MLEDLDETIRQILVAEIPIKNGEVEIAFDQPKREWSARLSRPTLNLFLYDVRENNVLRQHQWERLPGNGRDGQAHLKRMPFRVDCTYMLSSWATVPEDEHRLLTRSLLALFRFPVLPDDRLVGGLRNPPFEIQTRLASHDRLTNPAEVWASLDNEIRPSISYVVTLALDPWTEITSPVVSTLKLQSGQAHRLPRAYGLADGTHSELVDFGGEVRHRSGDKQPYPGIQVAIKGSGLFSASDQNGRYVLGSIPPGDYTLVAWPPEGKPVEKEVSLPGGPGDYDFEL